MRHHIARKRTRVGKKRKKENYIWGGGGGLWGGKGGKWDLMTHDSTPFRSVGHEMAAERGSVASSLEIEKQRVISQPK